jgi:hypothetical protein
MSELTAQCIVEVQVCESFDPLQEQTLTYVVVEYSANASLFDWLETRRLLTVAVGGDINVVGSADNVSKAIRRRHWCARTLEARDWGSPAARIRSLRPLFGRLYSHHQECVRPIAPGGNRFPDYNGLAKVLGEVGYGVRAIPHEARCAFSKVQWTELELLEDLDGLRAEDHRPPSFTNVEARLMAAAIPIVRDQLSEILAKLDVLAPCKPTTPSGNRPSPNSSEDALDYFNKHSEDGLESARSWENRFD